MRQQWRGLVFALFLFSLVQPLEAAGFMESCRLALGRTKGHFLAIVAGALSQLNSDAKYANAKVEFEGQNFSFTIAAEEMGRGAYGIVFPIEGQGPTERIKEFFPQFLDEKGNWRKDLVIKFPHKAPLKSLHAVMKKALIDENTAEQTVIDFCDSYSIPKNPAISKKILYASLDSNVPFLIKVKVSKGRDLDKMGPMKNLEAIKKNALKALYENVVLIENESKRILGKRIAIDIKPDNLYWDGTAWQFYELSRTPGDNTYFTQGGFESYLALVDGFSK